MRRAHLARGICGPDALATFSTSSSHVTPFYSSASHSNVLLSRYLNIVEVYMSPRRNHGWATNVGLILAVAAVYFLAAKLGLSLAFLNASVSPVWPPTGVAVALVFWLGYRTAPGVFIGALLANALLTSVSFAASSGIAFGNTLEALCAVFLLNHFAGSRIPFNRVIDVLRFVLFVVILSTAISATIGTITVCLGGTASWNNFGWLWLTWWLGDGVGALVITPLILSWVERPLERWSRRRWAEGAALMLALWLVSATIYTNLFLTSITLRPWGHVVIPLLLWAAFRFGPRGVATSIAMFAAFAIWGTVHGRGGFAPYSSNNALLYLQAYVADLAITTLLLAAIISERKHAERHLSGGLSVTRILAESPLLDDALPRILQRICVTFDWEVGVMWIADPDSTRLRCLKVWPPQGTKSKFEAICYTTTFARGGGLPGRVWQKLRPCWIQDVTNDDNFPRARVAAGEGLHAAFGFPIVSGENFLGAMEFFSHEIREPDQSLLAAFSGIGSQIGQFIERRRVEEALEPAKLLPSENPAPVMRLDRGRILTYANPAAEYVLANWKVSLGEEVPGDLAQVAEATLANGQRRNVELPLGRQVYLVTLSPVVEVNYVNLYFSDITDLKLTQEELLKNEEWLRLTMEGGRVGLWARDLDGSNRVVWSPELEEIFGLQPGEFAQTEEAFLEFVDPEDRKPLLAAVQEAVENHSDYTIEFRYTHKDGGRRWMLGRGRAFYDDNGKPYRLAGIGWDITQRKESEEALVRNQEALRLAHKVARGGTWQWDLRTNGVTWSQEYYELLQLDPQEVRASFDEWSGRVHSEDLPNVLKEHEQAVAEKRDVDVEFRIQRADGQWRWFHRTGRCIYDSDGKPTSMIGITFDVTERKRAEDALRESQLRYTRLLNSAMDAIITVDQAQEIVIFNPAAEKMFGCTTAEALGKPLDRFIPARFRAAHRAHVEKFGQTGVTNRRMGALSELSGIRANGEEFPIEASISQVHAGGEKLFKVILRDITERKRAEQEREQLLAREQSARADAEAANRLKDAFLATLSHELRTPLTAILGWLSIMQSQTLDKKTNAHAIETIEPNAKIQAQLIEDLVDVSRIVGGKLSLEMQPVNLLQVIDAAVEVVRPAAEAKGVSLRIRPDASLGLVAGDAARLQQVIWNLLSNAVKFTSRGGSVEVSLGRVNGWAEIVVRDTGAGIAPEFLPYVFERFRQAESPLTRSHRGLGLGLAIVRQLVELHRVSVSADSPGENQGATFTIRLPRASTLRPETTVPRGVAANEFEQSLAGLRVLVVEDEPDARELISLALKRSGAEVEAVASARDALSNLQAFTPDVLLSDIGLPSESGYDLIREIRALSSTVSKVPAIALTAFASDADRNLALSAGFHEHLAKPVEPAHLVAMIRRVVRGNF